MEKIYIFGHQKPDTDSVCASITLSYLKNKLGLNTEPKVLGHINNESKYVLNYFNVKEPEFLNDVKVQIKNMKFSKDAILSSHASINDAFNLMHESEETGICIVDENNKLEGLFTLKELAKQLVGGNKDILKTNIDNIAKVLNGDIFLKYDEEIEGKILVASFQSKTIIDKIEFDNDTILIVGDRYKVLEHAVEKKVKLIILTGNHNLPLDLLKKAEENKINIVCTHLDTYHTSNQLILSNYICDVLKEKKPTTIDINSYRNDFLTLSESQGYTNYPVVTKNNICLGLLKTSDVNQYQKLHVILVDHNGFSQSVLGIEEAIIDEIIDHHNLLNIGTPQPINFRSMPVGCTCTIIYHLYKENDVKIPKDMAGLMLSAILSDTLLLKSVTTTDLDRKVVEELANIAEVDIQKYGHDMVKAGFSIKGKKAEELLEEDIKTFRVKDKFVGISQIFTMDYDDIKADMENFINKIDDLASSKFDMVITLITDIEKNGSYIFYDRKSENVVRAVLNNETFKQGDYIQDLLSRKKQLVPNVMEVLER
ncbi:MAG: putative manganese-dependent inorganic diphosphatase [Bacilli bacterium]|nr:putative manganese-dependent inorganic diphosphatase [Bacilli bacterium]